MFDKNTCALEPFERRVYLASPTMHGEEIKYINEAYETNWMSTIGENINVVEKIAAEKTGTQHAVGLSSGTAALHLCAKLAAEKLYGTRTLYHGALEGKHVFCSDMTFAATLNPIVYEGGIPIFIDTDPATWNMDVASLERAFALYPDGKLVVSAELYGFPGRMDEIKKICEKHGALLIEDAAEVFGASVDGKPCAGFGDYAAISFNGNKIITGSTGGCLLTNSEEDAARARKWSTQARENAPWYQHEEIGYNYRMSNVVAGVIRGQFPHLEEHIAQKRKVYERYREGLSGLPVRMNPITPGTEPNYWLSALLIDEKAMCKQTRTKTETSYVPEHGKSCPSEILQAIQSINAEGRPIWKPMHLQPLYGDRTLVSRKENVDIGADIFARGCCLPSDNKMTKEQQDRIIAAIRACFA